MEVSSPTLVSFHFLLPACTWLLWLVVKSVQKRPCLLLLGAWWDIRSSSLKATGGFVAVGANCVQGGD